MEIGETGEHHFVQYEAAPRGEEKFDHGGEDAAGKFVDYFL
jgi:hypothetical protein